MGKKWSGQTNKAKGSQRNNGTAGAEAKPEKLIVKENKGLILKKKKKKGQTRFKEIF